MAEEFAFHEGSDEGRAVDGDEGANGIGGINRPAHHFLAGTGFAQDQCRPAARCELVYHPLHVTKARGVAHQGGCGSECVVEEGHERYPSGAAASAGTAA